MPNEEITYWPKARKVLIHEIAVVLNKHSQKNKSKTPDFMLAEYLVQALELFEKMTIARDIWLTHEKGEHLEEPPTY